MNCLCHQGGQHAAMLPNVRVALALLHRRETVRQPPWNPCLRKAQRGKAQRVSLPEMMPRRLEGL